MEKFHVYDMELEVHPETIALNKTLFKTVPRVEKRCNSEGYSWFGSQDLCHAAYYLHLRPQEDAHTHTHRHTRIHTHTHVFICPYAHIAKIIKKLNLKNGVSIVSKYFFKIMFAVNSLYL